jgi:hypothetical protein
LLFPLLILQPVLTPTLSIDILHKAPSLLLSHAPTHYNFLRTPF